MLADGPAVAIFLHGGLVNGFRPASRFGGAYLRMIPLSWAVRRRLRGRVTTLRIVYARRGWNGAEATPLEEVDCVLARIVRRAPHARIVLVGHSMGGRAALRLAGRGGVVGVVALAPWLPPDESVGQLCGRRSLIVHGTADRICPVADTDAYVERARAAGADVRYARMTDRGHIMARDAGVWHALAADHVVALLAPGGTSR